MAVRPPRRLARKNGSSARHADQRSASVSAPTGRSCVCGTPPAQPARQSRGGGQGEQQSIEIAAALHRKPGHPNNRLDIKQRVAAAVCEEHVVAAPEEPESRNRDGESRVGPRLRGVFAQQADIVVDVLEHVHHQHQIRCRFVDAATEAQRLAVDKLVAVLKIAGVDTGCRCDSGFAQQSPREESGPGAHIEQGRRAHATHESRYRNRFRAIVPVVGDRVAKDCLFLEVHAALPRSRDGNGRSER